MLLCSLSELGSHNDAVGDGSADELVEPECVNTESTEERILDAMEQDRWRAARSTEGFAEKEANSIEDSAFL